MLKAIHKLTNKLVPAFLLNEDLFWIEKESDEWIAPKPEIENWNELYELGIEEVKVVYIKKHLREGSAVQSHFRINTPQARENSLNESEEHKLAKEGIYEAILNNEIIINEKNISELGKIKDLDIEHRLSKSKLTKIADVCLTFEKEHYLYGKGIVFEIQFSYQNSELTQERTYDRILEGYSVCWLNNLEFNKRNKLNNLNLNIIPCSKAIEEYHKEENTSFLIKINGYHNLMDNKFSEINKKIEDYKIKLYHFEEEIDRKSNGEINFINEKAEETRDLFSNGLRALNQNIKEISEKATNKLNELKDEKINEIVNNPILLKSIQDVLNYDKIKEKIQESLLIELREPIILGVNKITEELIKEKYNKENFEEKFNVILSDLKNEMKPLIKEKLGFINGSLAFKCQLCSRVTRLETMKNIEGNFVCGECYNIRKTELNKGYYKRENGKI